jgi:signal transduction histidine kinase
MAVQSLTRVNDERARDLQQSLSRLQESHRRTLAEADALDREISETLHRTVQGRLSAASLMIRLDRRAEAEAVIDGIVEETLPELMASLRRPMTLPTHAQPSPTPTGTSGPLEHYGLAVTDEVDWDAITYLSPVMAEALRRSLSENLANAARHGHASVACVTSTVSADSVIVSCRDDGTGPSQDATSGLGSRIHDEVAMTYSGSWSLDRDGDQTVFTMCLHR